MSLLNTPVCVAVDHKYSENTGAWSEFIFFDGVSVTIEGGIYSDLGYNAYSVDATIEQIVEAAKVANKNTQETFNYNKYSGKATFIGCTVILKGSRKAPNKVELLVTDFNEGYFDNINYRKVSDTIRVQLPDNTFVDVSVTCIKEVVKGVKINVWWTPSAVEIAQAKEARKIARYNKRVTQYNAIVAKINEDNTKNIVKEITALGSTITVEQTMAIVAKYKATELKAFK